MSQSRPITVALVDDDADVRERFARVVGAEPTLRLVHAAASAGELLGWFGEHAVDVLLVDLGLPDRSGLDVIRRCRQLQPSCSVMVITIFGDEGHMLGAFEAGASGYLLKDGTESDLARHVVNLHAGGSPISPLIARHLLERWRARAPERPEAFDSLGETLSPREREVLDLVARGFTYLEVAKRLGLSVTTVQSHIRGIYGKLDVHNRTEAVFEARLLGLLR
jgi:DNA-binding NarL/FixJ family response regulator